jgi:vanillate O-demethylase ferredoxin subunit
LREAHGRGGSDYIYQNLEVGDKLRVSSPRNNFELDEDGSNHLLIGGGIGITPLIPMAARLLQLGKRFEFHHLCRSPANAAFRGELERALGRRVHFHYSYADANLRLDIGGLIAEQSPGTRIYACGSESILQTVSMAAEQRGDVSVRVERFARSPANGPPSARPFEVELASTGEVIPVPADQSILKTLRARGHHIDSACEEGLCGSCEVGLLEGEADHRDSVLTEAEKAEQDVLMVCCSRAHSPRLKLDL